MDDMFSLLTKTKTMPRNRAETSGAVDGGASGLTHGVMAGTKVASNVGMKAIEAVRVGDKVLTLHHGMQVVTAIRRRAFWVNSRSMRVSLLPVHVPSGALGNRVPLTLRADQGIEVESDAIADVFGRPSLVVPAQALVGLRGIRHEAQEGRVDMVTLHFAEEQVVYAESGAAIHCPVENATQTNKLSLEDAALVTECLKIEDQLAVEAEVAVA